MMRRRKHARQPMRSMQYVDFEGLHGALITDLSEAGAGVLAAVPMRSQQRLRCRLDLGTTSVAVVGQIVSADQTGRAGLHFVSMSAEDRQRLKDWLFEHALSRGIEVASTENRADQDFLRELEDMIGPLAELGFESPEPAIADVPAPPAAPARPPLSVTLADLPVATGPALAHVAQLAHECTGADGAAIALSRNGVMRCLARHGDIAPDLGVPLDTHASFSGQCIRSMATLVCDDSEEDGRVDAEVCRQLNIRSIVAAPVVSGGRVIGVLEIFGSGARAFAADDIADVERLAVVLAELAERDEASSARVPAKPPVASAPPPASVPARITPISSARPAATVTAAALAPTAPPVITRSPAPTLSAPPLPAATPKPEAAPKEARPLPAAAPVVSTPPPPPARPVPPPPPSASSVSATVAASAPPSHVAAAATTAIPSAAAHAASAAATAAAATSTPAAPPSAPPRAPAEPVRSSSSATASAAAATPVAGEASAKRSIKPASEAPRSPWMVPAAAAIALTVLALGGYVTWRYVGSAKAATPATAATNAPANAPAGGPATSTPLKQVSGTAVPVAATGLTTIVRTSAPVPGPQPAPPQPKQSVSPPPASMTLRTPTTAAARATQDVADVAPPSLSTSGRPVLPVLAATTSRNAPVLNATPLNRTSGGVREGKALYTPRPSYPEAARRLGLSGEVLLTLQVGPDGKVKNVTVTSGNAILAAAAAQAAQQWRYEPTTLDGNPINTSVQVNFKFASPR